MKRKVSSKELVFMAMCVVLGLVCKRFIAPLTNILTDFIRLPGGSATSAFSILFIVIAVSVTDWKVAGTVLCLIQAMVALGVGMSGNQGLFALVTFTVPGMIIDILRLLMKDRDSVYTIVSCMLANIGSAIASNYIVFGFKGSMLVLWILVAASIGIIAGMIGNVIIKRMNHIPDFVQLKYGSK